LEELYIIQQFKDFTKWYPWICTGNHDVRFMFAGNKIIEITLRVPKKWDFRSNIWSGGIQKNLSKQQIPKDLLLLSKKIYKDLNLDWTDIFSMDFAYCKKEKQRYLLEINASPGTWYYQIDKKVLTSICRWFVSFFKSIDVAKK
jgi:glutathione synthase/RimK-type ligase-like ATP-grasp enzyme